MKTTKKEFEILGRLMTIMYELNAADSDFWDDAPDSVEACQEMNSNQAGTGFESVNKAFRIIAEIAGLGDSTIQGIFDYYSTDIDENVSMLKKIEQERLDEIQKEEDFAALIETTSTSLSDAEIATLFVLNSDASLVPHDEDIIRSLVKKDLVEVYNPAGDYPSEGCFTDLCCEVVNRLEDEKRSA